MIISSLDIADGGACMSSHSPLDTQASTSNSPPIILSFFQQMKCLLPSKDDLNVNYHSNVEALKHPLYSTIIAALPELFMTFL